MSIARNILHFLCYISSMARPHFSSKPSATEIWQSLNSQYEFCPLKSTHIQMAPISVQDVYCLTNRAIFQIKFVNLPLNMQIFVYKNMFLFDPVVKSFPQIEFGIQWLLQTNLCINVTISLNLAESTTQGGGCLIFSF